MKNLTISWFFTFLLFFSLSLYALSSLSRTLSHLSLYSPSSLSHFSLSFSLSLTHIHTLSLIVNTGWELISILREKSMNIPDFDKKLENNLIPKKTSFDPSTNEWDIFQLYFEKSNGLVMYKPVFEKYMYKLMHDAATLWNVQLLELRVMGKGGGVYDFNTPEGYTHIEIVKMLITISKQVQADVLKNYSKMFLGCKLILQGLRSMTIDDVTDLLNDAIQLRLLFPSYVIGFDLVGEEDKGYSLNHFKDILLKAKRNATASGTQLNYYFHAGETNWYPDNTFTHAADNLYDAILLGTKRIGHGLALTKMPALALTLAREKTIAVEICPISNQVLQYVGDIRNHPATNLLAMGVPITLNPDDNAPLGYDDIEYDWIEAFISWNLNLSSLKQLGDIFIYKCKYMYMETYI